MDTKARKLTQTSRGPFVHSREPRREGFNVTASQTTYPMFKDYRVNRDPRNMNKGKI